MILCDAMLLAGLGYDFAPLWANVLLAIWLWCFGANVGSFMNVVVYRVPRGRSVVHPGSRCPQCGRPIRWFDNIPVLSWLVLRARCRDCRAPISGRYPLVEALMAALFLVIGFLAPIALERFDMRGPASSLTAAMPWLMYGYQMLLVCTLVAAALIRFDGLRPPARLFWPAMLVGVVLPQLPPAETWLAVRPFAFDAQHGLPGGIVAMLDSTTGVGVGWALGLLIWRASRWGGSRSPASSETAVLVLCGLMLGWQGACFVSVIGVAVQLLIAVAAWPIRSLVRLPWTASAVVGVVLFAIFWPSLDEFAPFAAGRATIAWFAVSVLVASPIARLAALARPVVRPPAAASASASESESGTESESTSVDDATATIAESHMAADSHATDPWSLSETNGIENAGDGADASDGADRTNGAEPSDSGGEDHSEPDSPSTKKKKSEQEAKELTEKDQASAGVVRECARDGRLST